MWFIHPCFGLCWSYLGMAGQLGDRPVYGIQVRGSDGAPLPESTASWSSTTRSRFSPCSRKALSNYPGTVLFFNATQSPEVQSGLWDPHVEGELHSYDINATHLGLTAPKPAADICTIINRHLRN